MNNFRLYLKLLMEGAVFAYNALVVNRLRTFLSLLGITIGIFAIISVFSLVDSMEKGVRDSFSSLGDDAVFLEKWPWGPEEGDKEYAWWKYYQRREIDSKDFEQLTSRITTARVSSFFANASRGVEYLNSSLEDVELRATTSGYEDFIQTSIEHGRSFSEIEFEKGMRYCVLGAEIASALFGSAQAVGKDIKIGGFRTRVIGVLERQGESMTGNGTDEWIILPVNFAKTFINVDETNGQIALRPKEGIGIDQMINEVVMNMRSIRGLRPQEDLDFSINKSSMISNQLDEVFGIITIVGGIIGGFSIIVGGFSIANIMFVSVRERTNIIGIQKALGAKRSFILFQFLFEAVALCLAGGAIGLILIFLISLVVSALSDFDLVLSLGNIMIGLGFSAGIGLISGVIPAVLAARMEPVEAIRANA